MQMDQSIATNSMLKAETQFLQLSTQLAQLSALETRSAARRTRGQRGISQPGLEHAADRAASISSPSS
jgi:hypothetical protein